jgi:hypothetical protein
MVGWIERMKLLQATIVDCEKINEKRGNDFLKGLEIVKELEGPQLLRNSKIITKGNLE